MQTLMARCGAVVLALTLSAGAASAQAGFSNGFFSGPSDGLRLTADPIATNFRLGSDLALTDATIMTTTWSVGAPLPATFPGLLHWAIYASDATGTLPSTSLATGTATPTGPVIGNGSAATGTWSFALPSVTLSGNTSYWFALATDTSTELRWNYAFCADALYAQFPQCALSRTLTPAVYVVNGAWVTWPSVIGPSGAQFSLVLNGTPAVVTTVAEPATLALLAPGLVLLAPLTWRRRRA